MLLWVLVEVQVSPGIRSETMGKDESSLTGSPVDPIREFIDPKTNF
jgi:hypothetical protein